MYTLRKIKITFAIFFVSLLLILTSPTYVLADAPYILLPSSEITMEVIKYPGENCYYNIMLSDVPSGYHVSDGIYLGWCVDEYHYISVGVEYSARMYSSYDENNPHPDPDWDKVNYILNHKQGTKDDIKEAIWFFVDGGNMPSTEEGRNMVEEAENNGEGFVPGPGQVLAVILWIDNGTQVPIIEVTVPFQNVVPQYPFGPILGVFMFMMALVTFKYRGKISRILKVS